MKPTTLTSLAFAFVLAACGGAQPTPGAPPSSNGSGSGSGSAGGSGSGSGTGDTGGSSGSGSGGTTTPPPSGGGSGGTTTPPPDGGTTPVPQTLGCMAYVSCLNAAMSDTDAQACDMKATNQAQMELDAIDTCALGYCTGMTGGATARCKTDANGNPTNLDGTPAFDMNGNPSGDCATCLLNVDAGLWGEQCMPATDAACNVSACATQVNACKADTAM